jgi:RNA polymerase sigma-70 factor (sigma-E family)
MAAEDDFREFAVARARSLRRTAYLLTGDHQHAEDLLQTTLTKVYLAWDRIRDPHAVEAYARRTLVTTYTSWWRRRSWQERPVDEIADHAEPDLADDVVSRADLWRMLHELPRQQRAVIVLRFYEDLSILATADVLGIGAGTVKSHTSRALSALRVRLGNDQHRLVRTEE